jgi:hypothetical protein
MHKFICEYNILDDYTTRENCLMLFGGMSRQDDINELGNVTLLGRWGVVGEVRGFCIVEAPDCETVQKWLINWVPMANIKVEPCLDDNEQRELILGREPSYRIIYDKINSLCSLSSRQGSTFIFAIGTQLINHFCTVSQSGASTIQNPRTSPTTPHLPSKVTFPNSLISSYRNH